MKSKRKVLISLTLIVVGISFLIAFFSFFQPKDNKGNRNLFDNNQTYHFEAIRSLGYAVSGGADIDEVLLTLGRIDKGSNESWYKEWKALAEEVYNKSQEYSYDPISKGNGFLKASNYYRTAEFFVSHLAHNDKDVLETYRKGVNAFYKGLELLEIPVERFDVPWGDKSLPGYYVRGESEMNGDTLIVVVNGYDSTKEEEWFTLGRAAYERGFSFVCYDGPGQGGAIREHEIYMTHEWAPVNQAVLDYVLNEHKEINEIVLVGCSVGSTLATKAAAADSRVDMLVQYDIMYDFGYTAQGNLPEFLESRVMVSGPRDPSVNRMLEIGMKADAEASWGLSHGAWIMNLGDDWAEVMYRYSFYENSKDLPQIRIPVLLLVGMNDHFVDDKVLEMTIHSLNNAESVTTRVYNSTEPGAEHCQVGAITRMNADLFEWYFANSEKAK